MLNPSDIRTVMNQCRVELTGVSDALLRSSMFEVMEEFFRDTQSWTEQIPFSVNPVTTQPTTVQQWDQVLSYPIAPSEGQIIALDSGVHSNGTYVPALMPKVGVVRLQYAPNVADIYTACVIKNVCLPLDREGFPIGPDWVLSKWHLAIKFGMLGTLMNQKNKSYSDDNGAKYNLAKFRQFVQNVRTAVLRANTRGAQAWRFPQSFRTISQKGGVPVYGIGNDWSG